MPANAETFLNYTNNTRISLMSATGSVFNTGNSASVGLVPVPPNTSSYVLTSGGTWVQPSGSTSFPYTGSVWTNQTPPVNLDRIDRLFVGAATLNDGTNTAAEDWLNATIPATTTIAQFASLSPISAIGLLGGAQTLTASAASDAIGVAGFTFNNNPNSAGIGPQGSWAFYGEAWKTGLSNTAVFTTGMELDIVNKSSPTTFVDPYQITAHGVTPALWLASGGGRSGALTASLAIGIIANTATFDKGIIFQNGSLTAPNGLALVLPTGYQIGWYQSLGVLGPTITSGSGSPNGVVTANPGSLYLNAAGGAGTSLYVKESGNSNTGWVGK